MLLRFVAVQANIGPHALNGTLIVITHNFDAPGFLLRGK